MGTFNLLCILRIVHAALHQDGFHASVFSSSYVDLWVVTDHVEAERVWTLLLQYFLGIFKRHGAGFAGESVFEVWGFHSVVLHFQDMVECVDEAAECLALAHARACG